MAGPQYVQSHIRGRLHVTSTGAVPLGGYPVHNLEQNAACQTFYKTQGSNSMHIRHLNINFSITVFVTSVENKRFMPQ